MAIIQRRVILLMVNDYVCQEFNTCLSHFTSLINYIAFSIDSHMLQSVIFKELVSITPGNDYDSSLSMVPAHLQP